MGTDLQSKKLSLDRFSQIRQKTPFFTLICANLWNEHLFIYVLICVICGSGCATRGYIPPPAEVGMLPGIYHRVNKRETLWRISKTYGISIEELIAINRIPDAARIYQGQLIFIPGAKEIQKVMDFVPETSDINFIWPANGEAYIYEAGIRILAKKESDVFASRSGRVIFCGEKFRGYGKIIMIDHRDGFITLYAHNLENLVKTGAEISQGSVIAKVGESGRIEQPGLYFEIRSHGKSQNPFFYLP